MKLICDFSFVNDYVENFFEGKRCSASIINSSISAFINGKPLLVISYDTIRELRELYSGRELVLDSVFSICEKSDIGLKDRIQSLIKITAIYEVQDKDTYVIAEDDFIRRSINRTTHKALSIKQAMDLLKEKGLLIEENPESNTLPSESTPTNDSLKSI